MPKSGSKVRITLTDEDEDVKEFEIDYFGEIILLNCILKIDGTTLYLNQVDVEGAGPNIIGAGIKKAIREIAEEFMLKYKTKHIVIKGAKRTAGRTKGSFLNTIKLSLRDTK